MAYIKDVQVGSDTYLIEPTLYIAPTKNGAAYTATLANFSLATGATVQAKFAATNNENATLNVNSTGAKEIHYNGDKITANQFKVNHVYTLVYDGTQWQVVGDIDTNTNTWRGIQDNLTSDSTTESLSAKQGKVLKGLIDGMDATTPAASGNATAFIDSITQTDGKITSITKKNIPTVSSSTAGLAPKGTAVSTQSTSTKFLREDGTWATPSYITNTDAKVAQSSNTEDKEFPIILKNTDNTTNETNGVKYDGDVTVNPSKSKITATTIQANSRLVASKAISQIITGTGTAGSYTNSTYHPAKWTFNTGLTATDGDIFTIKIPVAGHDYGVFMSVDNGSHYYPVVLNGTGRITTHYPVNTYLTVIFEPTGSAASMYAVAGQTSSTRITVTGGVWRVLNYYDSNSNDTGYYHRRIYPNLKAGTGSVDKYTIIMQLPNGRWSSIVQAPSWTTNSSGSVIPKDTGKSASTNGFMLGHVLLMYANATYADGANIGTYNIWSAHTGLIDARYSFNLANSTGNGFVAYTPVYIVGTVSDGLFHLDTTKWWTQTLPSSDDGKVYIYIGDAYDWYRLTFTEDKPIYWYKDGAVRLYSGASEYALSAPLSGISGADDLKAIEAISGTSGLLKKTAANTWTLDTNSYVTSSGVTKVSTGAGLTGGDITTTGTVKANLTNETKLTNAATDGTETSGRVYPVRLDKNGKLAVNVPWTNVNSGYLPLTGGTMTGNIRRYYNTASTEPMITMLSNNQDIILWEAGHGTAAATTTTSNHYKLLYKGTGQDGDNSNCLQLIAHKTDDIIAIQIDEIGKITLPQMATGGAKTPIYINSNGVITAGTALKALAYKDSLDVSDIPDLSWSKITSDKPTTLSGYGITDAKIASGVITLGSNTITPVTSVNGHTGKSVNVTAADLGLSNALHFIGITSTELADESTTATLTPKSTNSLSKTTGFVDGDVVMDGDQLREYVWSGDAWRLLGITTSTAYTQPASTATNTWIAQISQGTDGKITATTGSLNTSGTWSGTASKATTTANTTDTLYLVGVKSGATSTLLHDTSITMKGNAITAVTYNSTAASLTSETSTTANTAKYATLTLGNNANVNTTTAHSEGQIIMYSAATQAHTIKGTSTTTAYTHTLPNDTGLLVSLSDGTAKGSTTKPVYIPNTGIVTECSTYAGGTKVTFNGADKGASTASFYAPTAGGTAGHILIGAGATTAPAWYGGTVMSGTAAASWKTAFNGTTDATATNAAAVTIAGGLGVAKKLHVGDTATVPNLTIGSTNEYGDAYTPIYWHEGVPTAVTPIQYCEFTIGSGKKGVKLTHAAFTAASYVTQIVVTDGESNLNSTIAWESAAGYINLTCSATSGAVSGYILVSRGGAITATATDIT